MAEGNIKETVQTKSTSVQNKKSDEGDTVVIRNKRDKETIGELPNGEMEDFLRNASGTPAPSTVSSSEGATTPADGQDGGFLRNDSTGPDMSFEKHYDTTSNNEGAAGEDASPSNVEVDEERSAPKETALSKNEDHGLENASAVARLGVGRSKKSDEQRVVGPEKSLELYLDCPSGAPNMQKQSPSVFEASQHKAPELDKGGECSRHGSREASIGGETPVTAGKAVASAQSETLSVFEASQHKAPELDKGGECSRYGSREASIGGETPVTAGKAVASDALSVAGEAIAASVPCDAVSVAGGTAAASTKGDARGVAGGTAAASTKGDAVSVAGGTAAASTKGDAVSVAGGTAAASTKGDAVSVAGGTAAASTKGDAVSVAGGIAAASTKGDAVSVAGGTAAASTKGDAVSVAGGTAAASTKGDARGVAGGTAAAITKGDTPSTVGESVAATTSELPVGPTNHHASLPTASAVTPTSTNVPCCDPAVMNTEQSLSGSNQRPIATPSVSASLPAAPPPSMAFSERSYSSATSDSELGSVGLSSGSSTGQNSSPLSGPPSGSPEPHSSVLDATPMPDDHRSGIPDSAAMPGGSVVGDECGEGRLLRIATVCDGRTHESATRPAPSPGLPEWTANSQYLIRLMIQSDLLRQCPECVPLAYIARLPHVTSAFECTPSGSVYDRAASLSPSVPFGGPATVSTNRVPQELAADAVGTFTGRSTFSIVTTTTSSSICTTTTITTATASVNATITTTTLSGLPGHARVMNPQIGARVSSTIVLVENLPPQPASGGASPWPRAPGPQAPIFAPSLGPLLLLRQVMEVVDGEPFADLQSYCVDLANDVLDLSDDRDLPVAGGEENGPHEFNHADDLQILEDDDDQEPQQQASGAASYSDELTALMHVPGNQLMMRLFQLHGWGSYPQGHQFCIVCHHRPANIVIFNCHHVVVCHVCIDGSALCPFCRLPIEFFFRFVGEAGR